MNTINNNFSLRRLWNVLRIDLKAYTNTRMMYIGVLFILLASELGDLSHCIASYKMGVVDALSCSQCISTDWLPCSTPSW